MAIYKRDIVDINLETGNIHRSFLKHSIGYLDQAADHFGIRVLRNGEPVDLTGVTVQGIFMPPQGNPIAITTGNIIEGNVAEVVLPQACYNYDGQFCLSIKLVDATNAITGTMRIVDGMVDNTHASGTVAPTGAVPTYQEVLAVYDDMVAALVTVDELDDEVSDLKSALINCNTYDVLASIGGSINRTHRGITFTWNADKSICHMTGTATGGSAYDSIIDSSSAMPQGINAGTKLKIETSGYVEGARLEIFWYPNTLPDRELHITEDVILDIPAECTGVLFRMRVLTGTALPEGGIDVKIKMYSNYILDEDEYYGFKEEVAKADSYIMENTDGFDTIHYVVNVTDGEIRGSSSTYYYYRAGIPEPVSHGIYRCSPDYTISCYCWDGSTYLGAWNGNGTTTSASSILWAREFDIDGINKTLEATDLQCRIVAKRTDGATTDIGYGIIFKINKIQQEIEEKAGKRKSINILFIGNSFTEDENDYLPALLKEALPDLDFVIGILYKGGASLEEQWEQYTNQTTYARYSEYTNNSSAWVQTSNSVTMQQAVAKNPWDVITFQQASSDGTDYSTYQPYLNNLINALQTDIEKNIRFVLMLYHAYAEGYTATGYDGDSDAQYEAIVSAVQEAYAKTAVSDVIPTGTGVQNARTTTLDSIGTFGHLSYDGMHLEEGIPCLIPAYVTFLKVCEWIGYKEIGVLGSQILPDTTWVTGQNIPGKNWGGSAVGATAANRLIAAKCAIAAIKNPYQITDCSGM